MTAASSGRMHDSSLPSGGKDGNLEPGYPTTIALFAWLISHQPAVLFSHNKSATSNQSAVLFSHNKPAPAISHQPNTGNVIVAMSRGKYLFADGQL
jgi:hypothetical protein